MTTTTTTTTKGYQEEVTQYTKEFLTITVSKNKFFAMFCAFTNA